MKIMQASHDFDAKYEQTMANSRGGQPSVRFDRNPDELSRRDSLLPGVKTNVSGVVQMFEQTLEPSARTTRRESKRNSTRRESVRRESVRRESIRRDRPSKNSNY